MILTHIATLALSAGAVAANAPALKPHASSKLVYRADNCTFTDAATAIASKTACSTIVLNNISVPAGTTLDMTKLKTGTTVIFEGTTSFGYSEWKGPLLSFSGTNITITGNAGHLIDGNGPKWWDGKGSNGGKTKPKFFYAHSLQNSSITSLHVKNTPIQAFSVNTATNLTLSHITIDNSAGDASGGHNTDAFDVGSSSHIRILNANVTNQDDCLAINSGTDISFIDGMCVGGHGLSIGSVGGRSDNVVDGVLIANSTVSRSQNGVRIKTVYGATGRVSNVVYRNIALDDITKYGVVVQQDYENGSPTGEPTTGVPVTNLTVEGVTGSVGTKATPVYILCGQGSCSDWTWKDVEVSGGKASAKCAGVPSGVSC